MIAAVNGPAVTGGFALAVNTDFTIASERASFCDNELLVIGYGNKQLMASLQRRVGDAWTRELSLTSEYIDAATALRIGLVNHVVPHEELVPKALELAGAIAAKDRRAVSAMRRQWDDQQGLSLRTARRMHDSFHGPFKDAATAFADDERAKELMLEVDPEVLAVVAHADENGLIKPKAFVVLRPDTPTATDLTAALQHHVKAQLAPYKYPRWIEFVAELPKTATGKIQRFKLRA